jgi:hypothetical protein
MSLRRFAMRRVGMIVALGALLGMLGGAVTASPALADGRGGGWQVIRCPRPSPCKPKSAGSRSRERC